MTLCPPLPDDVGVGDAESDGDSLEQGLVVDDADDVLLTDARAEGELMTLAVWVALTVGVWELTPLRLAELHCVDVAVLLAQWVVEMHGPLLAVVAELAVVLALTVALTDAVATSVRPCDDDATAVTLTVPEGDPDAQEDVIEDSDRADDALLAAVELHAAVTVAEPAVGDTLTEMTLLNVDDAVLLPLAHTDGVVEALKEPSTGEAEELALLPPDALLHALAVTLGVTIALRVCVTVPLELKLEDCVALLEALAGAVDEAEAVASDAVAEDEGDAPLERDEDAVNDITCVVLPVLDGDAVAATDCVELLDATLDAENVLDDEPLIDELEHKLDVRLAVALAVAKPVAVTVLDADAQLLMLTVALVLGLVTDDADTDTVELADLVGA